MILAPDKKREPNLFNSTSTTEFLNELADKAGTILHDTAARYQVDNLPERVGSHIQDLTSNINNNASTWEEVHNQLPTNDDNAPVQEVVAIVHDWANNNDDLQQAQAWAREALAEIQNLLDQAREYSKQQD